MITRFTIKKLTSRDRGRHVLSHMIGAAVIMLVAAIGLQFEFVASADAGNRAVRIAKVPSTLRQNRYGFATFEHNLVATDFSVAAEVAASTHDGLTVTVEREHELGPRIATWRRHTRDSPQITLQVMKM